MEPDGLTFLLGRLPYDVWTVILPHLPLHSYTHVANTSTFLDSVVVLYCLEKGLRAPFDLLIDLPLVDRASAVEAVVASVRWQQPVPCCPSEVIYAAAHRFRCAKVLDLSYHHSMTDTELLCILTVCRRVSSLNLKGCDRITDTTLSELSERGAASTTAECDDDRAPITSLSVQGAKQGVTSRGVVAFAMGLAGQLRAVNVQRCAGVRDAGVLTLAKYCPNLTDLNIAYCPYVSDAALGAVARHCTALVSLSVAGCKSISTASICEVATACGRLEAVNMARCPNMLDAALIALGHGCPRLRRVTVTHSPNITDDAVIALAAGCPELVKVNLSECKRITDDCLGALLLGCASLQAVDVSGCGVSVAQVEAVRRADVSCVASIHLKPRCIEP